MNFDKVPELDHSRPRRWTRIKRVLGPVLLAAGIVAVLAAGWWLNGLRKASNRQDRLVGIEVVEERVRDCERRLAAVNDGSEEQLAVLEEGVVCLRELIAARGDRGQTRNRQLEDWQRRIADFKAVGLLARSQAAEAKAELAAKQADVATAAAEFREAGRLQRQVNNSSASPRHVSLAREAMLLQQADRVVLEPRAKEMRAAINAGERAEKAGDPVAALAAYRQARDLQAELNRSFPESAYANRAELERLESMIASLLAAELDLQVTAALAKARTEVAAGRFAEAEEALARATSLQERINREYPRSRFHAPERLIEFEVERQSARAGPRLQELGALLDRVGGHLRRREIYQAQQRLAEAGRLLESLTTAEPRARGLDEAARRQVDFLTLEAGSLAEIQDPVYALLRPLPGSPAAAMLAAEVSQGLFSRLMRHNPSVHAGPELPVDSVTRAEAQEFCRRLGWILGFPVRLPTLAELAAVAPRPSHVWSAENSGGQSQPAGAGRGPADFADVVGNLAEWVATEADAAGLVEVAGGSYATPIAEMRGLPVRKVPPGGRSREIGFRVVVEVDLAAK